ncbi:enoyl-CoA hydratase/isomerase family protein [Chloroflexota bacterium]
MGETKWPNVILEKEGKIARLTLNYPEKLNAFDFPGQGGLTDQFHAALDDVEKDDDIVALILKGSGRAFTAGHDLSKVGFIYGMKEPKPGEKQQDRPSQRIRLDMDRNFMYYNFLHFIYYPKITIAQIHGYCVAEGMQLAAMCDIAIAAEDAKLGLLNERLGFAGAGGATLAFFYLSMGIKRALDLVLTGRLVDGKEAERIGLITRAVPAARLEEVTEAMAQLVSLLPRDGIAIGKAARHLLYDSLGITSSLTIGYVTHTMFTNLKYSPDEFTFFKERRDKGPREAMAERNKKWDALLEKIYGSSK